MSLIAPRPPTQNRITSGTHSARGRYRAATVIVRYTFRHGLFIYTEHDGYFTVVVQDMEANDRESILNDRQHQMAGYYRDNP
jgi:hypothetical protein